jgi:CDGSH-type Zn-finger protein/uncharacterized Fe-S cluster protein YjdI
MHAGLSFALPRSFGPLVQANAAQILGERTEELADACHCLESTVALPEVARELRDLAELFHNLHEEFEGSFLVPAATLKQSESESESEATPRTIPAGHVDDDNQASTDDITIRFDTQRCIHSRHCVLAAPRVFLANVKGPWLHPEEDSVEHLVQVAHSCPSGAITYERHDGGVPEGPPEVNVINIRQNGPYAMHATLAIEGQAPLFRATLCRCGQSGNKPFCDNSHIEAGFEASGEPESVPSDPLDECGGQLRIKPLIDGPLKVQGPVEICSGTGRTVSWTEGAVLCRCGGSATKPFCDGTHQRIGFRSRA